MKTKKTKITLRTDIQRCEECHHGYFDIHDECRPNHYEVAKKNTIERKMIVTKDEKMACPGCHGEMMWSDYEEHVCTESIRFLVCVGCGRNFFAKTALTKYCGSYKDKTGCAYFMVLERARKQRKKIKI